MRRKTFFTIRFLATAATRTRRLPRAGMRPGPKRRRPGRLMRPEKTGERMMLRPMVKNFLRQNFQRKS